MKNVFTVIAAVWLVFLLHPLSAFAAECSGRCCDEEYPKITVRGEGKVEAMADKASFHVTVRVEEKRLQGAFEKSAGRINALTDTLSANGVGKDGVRNLGYVYHPLYEGKRIFSPVTRPTSYEVVYTLKATVSDLDNLGKILTALSDIQEISVYGLTYASTRIDELKREALKKAAVDARESALKLAEGSGAALGKVVSVQTAAQVSLPPYARQRMTADSLVQENFMAAGASTTPQIESGYLEITGSCLAQYAIQ